MLYPINIEVKRKKKTRIIKEYLQELKNGIKRRIKYLIFDRTNLAQRILVKLHI